MENPDGGARLSAHIPVVTKYGQWALNNKVSLKSPPPPPSHPARKTDG